MKKEPFVILTLLLVTTGVPSRKLKWIILSQKRIPHAPPDPSDIERAVNGGNYQLEDLRKLRDLVDEKMKHRLRRVRSCLCLGNESDAEGFWTVVRRCGRLTTRTRNASRTMTCSQQSVTKATDTPGQVDHLKRSKEVLQDIRKSLLVLIPSCIVLLFPLSEGMKNALFQVPSSAQFQFPDVLEAEFLLDPEFRQRVVGLQRMLRVRDSLQAKRACAVEHDSHDVVIECGSGKTVLKNEESEVGFGEHDSHDAVSECSSGETALKSKGSDVASGSCHPVPSCGANAAAVAELSVVSCTSTSRPSLARRFLVGDSRLSLSCQRALPDGVGGGQPRVAKPGESTGIIGSLERHESRSSLLNFR